MIRSVIKVDLDYHYSLVQSKTVNIIVQITEVDGALVPPSHLVEHGTQHDTIGSNLSTSRVEPIMMAC